MARGKKDSPAVGGSGDPVGEGMAAAAAAAVQDEEEEMEEQGQGGEEEEAEEEEDEDEDEDEEEYGYEETEEAAAEEPAQVVVTEEALPPKLAEGFYEIEAIRRRRLRKGQLQYLVKWRGWPESANTWEPLENLKACSDIVDAFEKRARSPRSCRKHKRKITTTSVTGPNPSHGKRGRPPRSDPRSLSRPPAPEPKKLPCRTSSRRTSNNSNRNSVGGLGASVNVVGQQMLGERVTQEGSCSVLSAGFPCQEAPISVSLADQQDEHQLVNGLSKVDNLVQAPPSQGVQVTGAKKRKSGCVRRFKQDEATQEQGELHNGRCDKSANEDVASTAGETGDRNKGDDCANRIHITKIIKPVRYFATISNDVQQVSITFKALRSDGQEVFVDDKELKANNPLVLISYYEQHLRYNPSS